jgi:hypothetical protein
MRTFPLFAKQREPVPTGGQEGNEGGEYMKIKRKNDEI